MLINFFKPDSIFYSTLTLFSLCCISPAFAGDYQNSAHGNTTYGINRDSLSGFGYSIGNCAHCHEQHASVVGSEPAPNSPAGPDDFTLFADNFNTSKTTGAYIESDNMCFYCHGGLGATFQHVYNYDHARTFGGYSVSSVDNMRDTFNQASYHNLYDIRNFILNESHPAVSFAFFTDQSNPCVACHNPHRAKRNKSTPADPANTAISRSSDHESLWGDSGTTELMSKYSTYQSPYYYYTSTPGNYEPGDVTVYDGSKTVDYVTFCLDCHQYEITSTALGTIPAIDWSSSVHGSSMGRDGSFNKGIINAPYDDASASDYVLSCLDCHEPHGSQNAFLLRKEVNGKQINLSVNSENDNDGWEEFCSTCHTISTTGSSDDCVIGHGTTGSWPSTPCENCHYHGSTRCDGANYTF